MDAKRLFSTNKPPVTAASNKPPVRFSENLKKVNATAAIVALMKLGSKLDEAAEQVSEETRWLLIQLKDGANPICQSPNKWSKEYRHKVSAMENLDEKRTQKIVEPIFRHKPITHGSQTHSPNRYLTAHNPPIAFSFAIKGFNAAISSATHTIILILNGLLLVIVLMLFPDRIKCALWLYWHHRGFWRQPLSCQTLFFCFEINRRAVGPASIAKLTFIVLIIDRGITYFTNSSYEMTVGS